MKGMFVDYEMRLSTIPIKTELMLFITNGKIPELHLTRLNR